MRLCRSRIPFVRAYAWAHRHLEMSDADFIIPTIGFANDLVTAPPGAPPTGGLTCENEISEALKKPATRRADLWLLGNNRLLCGGSISPDDVIRLMDVKRGAVCHRPTLSPRLRRHEPSDEEGRVGPAEEDCNTGPFRRYRATTAPG
jgi:hypothetical protein